MIFRAIWPIVHEATPYARMCHDAQADLPLLIAQAHCRVIGPGRFSVAPSCQVPGSGRVTESVLVWEAPAESVPTRAYWAKGAVA